MPRLFIGWELPEDVRREVGAAVEPLRRKLPDASWVRPETYHLTFAFLGDQPESAVTRIGGWLDASFRDFARTEVRVTRPGFFLSAKRPRVGWLAVEPEEALVEVGERVREAMTKLELELDGKSFRPHLTLVRTRKGWRERDARSMLEVLAEFRSGPASFDRVSLFGSELTPRGAIHNALHTVGFVSATR